jgi:hypothetical protein
MLNHAGVVGLAPETNKRIRALRQRLHGRGPVRFSERCDCAYCSAPPLPDPARQPVEGQ